jgi:phosphoglycerate dehydrogenase-like enzyme
VTTSDGLTRPTVVTLVFPDRVAPIADAIRAHASSAGVPIELREVGWIDERAVRRAKALANRSAKWLESHERPLDDAQRAVLAEADVLVGFELPVGLERLSPRARFVQATAAGVAPMVGALKCGGAAIRLSSAAGLSGDKVAEFAMARLLSVWTDGRKIEALQRARRWAPDEVDTTTVRGRTVVVVGTGGIGQAFARRAAAFDVRCVGVRRRPELGTPPGFERVVGPDGFLGELHGADAVLLALPETKKTGHLVGAEELAAMKPGAVLCNVARGALVDEDALVAALTAGRLGAAVLDVAATEPLPRRSPLWRAPNVYLSPHVANDWEPPYVDAIARLLVENILRDEKGEQLLNLVDLDEGY